MNALNSEGDSVLHSIVKRQFKHHRQKQEYLTALLMYSDVDVNLLNAQKTAALHIAVEVGLCIYYNATTSCTTNYSVTRHDQQIFCKCVLHCIEYIQRSSTHYLKWV